MALFSSDETGEFRIPTAISVWDAIVEKITPESEGERLVNMLYGKTNGVPSVPASFNIDPSLYTGPAAQDLSSLPVYVSAKRSVVQAVTRATDSVQGFFIQYGIIALAILIGALLLWGFLPALGRKLAK